MAKKKQTLKKFLKKHWSNILLVTFIVLMVFPQIRMPIIATVQRIIAFAPSTTKDGDVLTEYNWPLRDMEGNRVFFNEAKGEVSVLNFWATWCPPCVAEMPYFQNLYEAYGDKVKFYFVSNEDAAVIEKFMEKHDYNLPVQLTQYAPPELLQSSALPTTFIFGKDGKIHVKKKGSAKWDSKSVFNLLNTLLEE